MLLPRPEMRIATRRGSRIVSDGPVLGSVPSADLPVHRAAPPALFDAADLKHGFSGAFEFGSDHGGMLGSRDHGHADAAIEGPRELAGGDGPALLKKGEDGRQRPARGIDDGVATIGKNPRDILEKSAAGDVRKTADAPLLNKREQGADVNARRLEQSLRKRRSAVPRQPFMQVPAAIGDDSPNQGETIAVHAGACEAEDDVAGCNACAGEHLFAVDVTLDDGGNYLAFDASSPLATASGKQTVVESMSVRRPAVAVGDASTDLAMRPAVDCFVCFTGFRRRDAIVRQADAVVATFDELVRMVFPA